MERIQCIKEFLPNDLSNIISEYDYYIEGKIEHIDLKNTRAYDFRLLNENQIVYINNNNTDKNNNITLNILNLDTNIITILDTIDSSIRKWYFHQLIDNQHCFLFVHNTKIFLAKNYGPKSKILNTIIVYYNNLQKFEFNYQGDIIDIIQISLSLYCIATKKQILIWELITNAERKISSYDCTLTDIILFKSIEQIIINDGDIKLWDYKTNTILKTIAKDKPGYYFKKLDLKHILIYKNNDFTQYIYDGINIKEISLNLINSTLQCFDGQIIYDVYGIIYVYNINHGTHTYTSNTLNNKFTNLDILPDNRIITIDGFQEIMIWSLKNTNIIPDITFKPIIYKYDFDTRFIMLKNKIICHSSHNINIIY